MAAKRPRWTRKELLTGFRERVETIMSNRNFDLLDSIVRQAQGLDHDMFREVEPEQRAALMNSARKTLVEYAYPKLKAVEVSQTEPVRIEVVDMTGRAPPPPEEPDMDMLS